MSKSRNKIINVDVINNNFLESIVRYIGNTTTKASDLLSFGKRLFGDKFIGVFSADTIPKMSPNTYAIVNLDNSKEPGSHWIALVKTKNEIIVYDSYGRRTTSILPSLYQTGNGVVIESENDAEQTKKEKNCGARVLAALLIYDQYGKSALLKL